MYTAASKASALTVVLDGVILSTELRMTKMCGCAIVVQLQNVGMNRVNYHYLLGGLVRSSSVYYFVTIATASAVIRLPAARLCSLCIVVNNIEHLQFTMSISAFRSVSL